ncbi:FecCD family ABC transporter permease [Nitrincola schmidtii]|uniref:FecCD family ABC transporter permease n=1 Tax=Nitrincola schmidtii TaxID=1730894 RepID=UPI001F0DE806|nr:iron ABC transporter permease [Nitrincola schmidtii]
MIYPALTYPVLILLLIVSSLLSLSMGSSDVVVFKGLWEWIFQQETLDAIVVGDIRLPRTLIALLVGAALGLSGAALQGLLRNPLADPGLTGASQGAALGAAAVFYFGVFPQAGGAAPAMAGLLGAGLAMMLMLFLAGSARQSMVIMAGLAISTLTGALLAMVLNFAPNPYAMQELVFWLLGSVANRGFEHLWILLPALIIGGGLVFSQRRLLFGLSLGENVATSLGLSTRWGSRLVVLGAAILVGTAVSIAGAIGFVGLIVPHLVRPFVSNRPDKVLLPSALAGAILVCLADTLIRSLPPGPELKLGVLTSLLGTPLFIWLIWRERRRWL